MFQSSPRFEEWSAVDGGGSDREGESVSVDAALAASAVAVCDEPCDRALDHLAVLVVVGDEISVGGPAGPVRSEQLDVFADDEHLAIDGGGAAGTGQPSTLRSE